MGIVEWIVFIFQWFVALSFTGALALVLWACTVPFTYRTTDEDRHRHLDQIGHGDSSPE